MAMARQNGIHGGRSHAMWVGLRQAGSTMHWAASGCRSRLSTAREESFSRSRPVHSTSRRCRCGCSSTLASRRWLNPDVERHALALTHLMQVLPCDERGCDARNPRESMFGRTGAQPWIRQCTHPQGAGCRVVRSLRRGDALLVARAFISWWALAEEAHLQRVDNADPGSRKRILRTWCTAETARAPRQRIGREGVSGGVRGLCGRVRKALLSPGRAAGFHRINSLPRRTCDPLRRHESEIDRTRLTSGDEMSRAVPPGSWPWRGPLPQGSTGDPVDPWVPAGSAAVSRGATHRAGMRFCSVPL